MPVARSTGFDMRNTQNISIIRSEPPRRHDETTWSLSGAAGLYFMAAGAGYSLPDLWQ
jgi:hypothetical protein